MNPEKKAQSSAGTRLKPPAEVEKIARALLYEGYLLYPYRRSALKNRHRWNFGVLYPENSNLVRIGAETDRMQIELLLVSGLSAGFVITVRFLHLGLKNSTTNTVWEELQQEGVEREVVCPNLRLSSLAGGVSEIPFVFEGTQGDCESIGKQGGTILKHETLNGLISIKAEQVRDKLFKISAQIQNVTACDSDSGTERDRALLKALVSTHVILQASEGEFISLLDPPEIYRDAIAACSNVGAWPVLAGEDGDRRCVLASPIILYDYPQVAPESPGDLFDGTEIDELLTLRILTLTAEEKQEILRGDSRVQEVLARSEGLPGEQILKMHGAVRGLRATKEAK